MLTKNNRGTGKKVYIKSWQNAIDVTSISGTMPAPALSKSIYYPWRYFASLPVVLFKDNIRGFVKRGAINAE